jgi:hypothetical protein
MCKALRLIPTIAKKNHKKPTHIFIQQIEHWLKKSQYIYTNEYYNLPKIYTGQQEQIKSYKTYTLTQLKDKDSAGYES